MIKSCRISITMLLLRNERSLDKLVKMKDEKPLKIENSFISYLKRELFTGRMDFLKNLAYHFQRIYKNVKLKKSVDVSTENILSKSQQVIVQLKNVLSEYARSNILDKMN